MFHYIFRACCPATVWRSAVRAALQDGQRQVVDRLLKHAHAAHFRFDYRQTHRPRQSRFGHALHSAPVTKSTGGNGGDVDCDSEEYRGDVQNNVFDHDDDDDEDTLTWGPDSVVPSSVLTDEPPSLISYSSSCPTAAAEDSWGEKLPQLLEEEGSSLIRNCW